jgi:cobyrinic acid a,c-diamide synthase
VRIGIARDRAFGFYYPDDLAALQAAGAELVPIDTLHDTRLPAMDGLFIGGGFPEACLDALQANAALRHALRSAVEAGLPTYAECGGLMYLARSITWQGRTAPMVGAIPGDAVMHARPVGRGYVQLQATGRGCGVCALMTFPQFQPIVGCPVRSPPHPAAPACGRRAAYAESPAARWRRNQGKPLNRQQP